MSWKLTGVAHSSSYTGTGQCRPRMDTLERPVDFHPQDWIIIVEALAQWAGPPDRLDGGRQERGYELIEAISAEQGLTAGELLLQIDSK